MENSRKINSIGKVAIIAAIICIGLGVYGLIGAARMNTQLAQMGMSFIEVNDALSAMRRLSAYAGSGMEISGMNALTLVAVDYRVMLLIAGAITMISGIIMNWEH